MTPPEETSVQVPDIAEVSCRFQVVKSFMITSSSWKHYKFHGWIYISTFDFLGCPHVAIIRCCKDSCPFKGGICRTQQDERQVWLDPHVFLSDFTQMPRCNDFNWGIWAKKLRHWPIKLQFCVMFFCPGVNPSAMETNRRLLNRLFFKRHSPHKFHKFAMKRVEIYWKNKIKLNPPPHHQSPTASQAINFNSTSQSTGKSIAICQHLPTNTK